MRFFSFSQNGFKNLRFPVIASGITITILAITLYIANPHSFRLIDNRLYDLCLGLAISSHSGSDTGGKNDYRSVIVDIDEYSLAQLGQWPWPRYHVARLLNKIHDAGAVAVGIDILFAEPDRTSPVVIQKALKKDFNIDLAFSKSSHDIINAHNLMDNDTLLARAIAQTSSTLGYYFKFNQENPETIMDLPASGAYPVKTGETEDVFSYLAPLSANIQFKPGTDPSAIFRYLFQAVDIVPPITLLLHNENSGQTDKENALQHHEESRINRGNTSTGFMNTIADDDGVLRRTPLFISWKETMYPQLALATLMSVIKNSNPLIKISPNGVESMTIGTTVVPLDHNGSIWINYRGPAHTFAYISAARIMDDKIDPDSLKGKIVFIGSSAAGLKDIRVSPLDQNFPGVEVHATIVDNILKGDFISRPDWTTAFEALITILCGIVTTFLIGWAGPVMTLLMTIAAGSSILFTSAWALDTHHIWICPLFPFLVLSANFAILNLVKYGLSEKDKKFYRSAFGHYVSRSVVDQIIESPEKFNLDGEEKQITILFSDIRNFSAISEALSPSQVSRLLHDYFTPITRTVISHQGTLDKFIGDAMMCFWNAPLNISNHKALALDAAIDILETLEGLSHMFKKKYGVEIKTGIGMHSGVCRVGNMGSADLFDYTAIGDNVNIASRLEGLTKFYGVEVLFSQSMIPESKADIRLQNKKTQIQYVDRVRVKGKTEPVNIYTARWLKEDIEDMEYSLLKEELDHYHHAIEKYVNKDFKMAFEIFSELDKKESGSTKIYSIYRQRSLEFIDVPPDHRWDGVFNHTSK
ncbi:MAG: adenylate/guanylate cyclase domain-containing protein [Desulfamplus sp.]|nr:adenylate/guanylate cyclase domain-containing protein [Desulfamplus sp.]